MESNVPINCMLKYRAVTLSSGWHIFNGNEIGALLGWWELQNYLMSNENASIDKSKLYFIASTVSSKLLRSIAWKEGLNFEASPDDSIDFERVG